jgi:hypothetical protein
MAHINSHALAPSLQPKLRYELERDFVPIVLGRRDAEPAHRQPDQPEDLVKELVALCKAGRAEVSFGSAGARLGAAPGARDVQAAGQGRRAARAVQGQRPLL